MYTRKVNNIPVYFLSQAYQDAQEEYRRVLLSSARPRWDYIILTASNECQAAGFRRQLEYRRNRLPQGTRFAVVPDEDGVRIGSGGATLSVLRYLVRQFRAAGETVDERDPFAGKRILVIHSGGDSKRVPQYSALGKLFSPVPHVVDGRPSTLFDEFLIATAAIPGRIGNGMLLLSGDVLLLFNPLLIDFSGRGAAVLSFKEAVGTGKDHGVYLRGQDGMVRRFLHKQSEQALAELGAVNDQGEVDIDTGSILLGTDVLSALYQLVKTEREYQALVNNSVCLNLYGDFQFSMAADSAWEEFEREKPEGKYCPELTAARRQVWEALHPFRMKLLRLAPAKFIHFGTSRELLEFMSRSIDSYAELGWSKQVCSSLAGNVSGCNAVLSNAEAGENIYLEFAHIHGGARIGNSVILSGVDIDGEHIPDNVVLHGLKQRNGKFVCRIYGVEDDPKKAMLFGRPMSEFLAATGLKAGDLWAAGDEEVLWTARLYPVCPTIREAVAAALKLHQIARGEGDTNTWRIMPRKSLASGFEDADTEAALAWNQHMSELVQMEACDQAIKERIPAKSLSGSLSGGLTAVQREWLEERTTAMRSRGNWLDEMRLHYYVGTALNGAEGERECENCFKTLSAVILEHTLSELTEAAEIKIQKEEQEISLPLRVNFGGGWSDTPPYCIECGGTVLNAAILLRGERPVQVRLKKLNAPRIEIESRDLDAYGEFVDLEELQRTGDPYDPFALQKAALLACGIIPQRGGELSSILEKLGGGFRICSEVIGVPKGSGLGTSSILAGACVKGLFEFMGIAYDEDKLYTTVLAMEQLMSTGGGWQDQVGGLSDGIKYITSKPGLTQQLQVEHISLEDEAMKELQQRFALIYTGQRRLARNLLREVVGRYVGNEQECLRALNEIQRIATLMRFELKRGNIDAFAALMDEHWTVSQQVDAGSSNLLIEQIFASITDLIDGRMICGAGGGGFLQVLMKKGVTLEMLRARLQSVFADSAVDVWECELV